MGETLDLEAETDRLYQLPPGEFVAARKTLAARVDDPEARRAVESLSRPTVTAWAVNQVFHRARPLYDAVIDGAAQVAAAHAGGDAEAVREAMRARRAAVDTACADAGRRLRDAGHGASVATMRRIAQTFEALAAWGTADGGPHPGRLSGDVAPPGLDLLAQQAVMAPPPPRTERDDDAAARAAAQSAARAIADADAELALRTREAAVADSARADAEQRLAAAQTRVDEAAARLAELEQQLLTAQTQARDARAAARKAAAARTRAAKRLDAARDRRR